MFKCRKCKEKTDNIYTANNNADMYCSNCFRKANND